MDFDAAAAKAAGHSDADIARIQQGIAAARAAGRSDEEIQQYLQAQESGAPSTPSTPSKINPQDRLLPEVRALGPNANDADIQATLDKRNKAIADQQAAQGYVPQAKEFVRSVGEGVASIPEQLTAIPNAFANAARLGVTTVSNAVQGKPLTEGFVSVPNPTPLTTPYNKVLPPDPNFPLTSQIGRVAGPAIVEAWAPMLGGTNASLRPLNAQRRITQGVVRPAVQTGVTVGGQEAGGQTGRYVAENTAPAGATPEEIKARGDVGEQAGGGLGSVFGSVTVPPVIAQTERFLKPILTDEKTPERIRNWDAAGVPISAGGVGSKYAGVLEDAAAGIPFAGGPSYKARRSQREAMDAAALSAAQQIRGGPYQGPGIDEASIGGMVRDAAGNAIDVTKLKGDAVLNPIYDPFRDMAITQGSELTDLEALKNRVRPVRRLAVQAAINDTNETRLDTAGPLGPKVVDPQAEAMLQSRRTNIIQSMNVLPPNSPIRPTLEANLRFTEAQIQANRGSTGQEVIEQRSDLNRPIENALPLPASVLLDAKKIKTNTLRDAAILHGTATGPEFDAAQAEYSKLAEQRKLLNPVADQTNEGAAYSQVFGQGGNKNLNLQQALDQNTPDPALGKLLADNLELKLRGPRSAGSPLPDAETIDPKRALTWWSGLPNETKAMYAPPGSTSRAKLDALTNVYADELRRPTRTLPGAGGNTLGAPATLYQNPALLAGIGAAGFEGGGGPGATLAGASPIVAARVISSALTNPNFVRSVANPRPYLQPSDLARLMTAAVANRGQ